MTPMTETEGKSIRIGVLSDTHIDRLNSSFLAQIDYAFKGCSMIVHAGDITGTPVIDALSKKAELHAVHGNMCSSSVTRILPESLEFSVGGCRIGVCHGAGYYSDIEAHLLERFPGVDCIIYGHTHQARVHRTGGVLYVNPGSFMSTGRFGSPATYAIITADNARLSASLHEIPQTV